MCVCVCVCTHTWLFSPVWRFVTPWTLAHQAPLSMEFSRQEYWSRMPFPSTGVLPNPGSEPRSPALQANSLPSEHPGSPPNLLQSVHFSGSVMSNSLRPHEPQHTRPPCPSPTPAVYPDSCPLTQWCHPTISSSVVPFSSCLQSFPTSGSFQMSQYLHQVAKILQFHLQPQSFQWTPRNDLLYDGLVASPYRPGMLKSLLKHHSWKASILPSSAFFILQLSHPYMTTGKTKALTRWTFVDKVMSLLFNTLSRLVVTFLPRSKCLLISWLQSLSAVILEPPKIVWHCFHCFPIYFPWSDAKTKTRCHDLSFLNVEL